MYCMLSISPCIRFVLFYFMGWFHACICILLILIPRLQYDTYPFWHLLFLLFFLSFLSFLPCFCFYDCSHWSFVLINTPLVFSCQVNHVPDWQLRTYFLGLLSIHHTHTPYHIRGDNCQNVYWVWLRPNRSVSRTHTHTISIIDPPLGESLRVAGPEEHTHTHTQVFVTSIIDPPLGGSMRVA